MPATLEAKPLKVRLNDQHVDKSALLPDALLARAPKAVKVAQDAAGKAIDHATALADKYGSEVYSNPLSTDEEIRDADDATKAAWKDAWRALYAYAGAIRDSGESLVAECVALEADARRRVAQAALDLARARAEADDLVHVNAALAPNRGEPRDLRFDHRGKDVGAVIVRKISRGVQPPHYPAAVPPKLPAVLAWAVVDSGAEEHWNELVGK